MVTIGSQKHNRRGQPLMMRLSLWLCVLICAGLMAVPAAMGGVDSSSLGYRTSVVLSDGDYNHWSMGESFTETRLSTQASWLKLRLNIRYGRPDGDLRWGQFYDPDLASDDSDDVPADGSLSGRVVFERRYLRTGLSIAPPSEWASLNLSWRQRESDDDFSCGLSLQPTQHFSWAVTRSLTHPLPSLTELFYYFEDGSGEIAREGGTINWHAPTWTTGLEARAKWFGRLILTSSLKDSDFRPAEPQPSDPTYGGYAFVLEGKSNSGHIAGEYLLDSSRTLAASYQHLGINSRCRGFLDGQQFAYFGLVNLSASMWSMSYRHGGWRIGVMMGSAEGECGGTIQAWPFLNGLARFLGERRHFVGEGNITFKHAALDIPAVNRSRFAINSRLDFVHLEPDLRYVTWRPVLFGFGIDDLKAEQFDIVKADLLRLSISPNLKWKSLRLECEVSQWIPVFVSELSDGEASDGTEPGEAGSSSPSSNTGNTWSGFSASIRLIGQL